MNAGERTKKAGSNDKETSPINEIPIVWRVAALASIAAWLFAAAWYAPLHLDRWLFFYSIFIYLLPALFIVLTCLTLWPDGTTALIAKTFKSDSLASRWVSKGGRLIAFFLALALPLAGALKFFAYSREGLLRQLESPGSAQLAARSYDTLVWANAVISLASILAATVLLIMIIRTIGAYFRDD